MILGGMRKRKERRRLVAAWWGWWIGDMKIVVDVGFVEWI